MSQQTTSLNYEEIYKKGRCNWCRNFLIDVSEPITEANFMDVGKKYPALFCSNCLAIEFRTKQPKMCFNPQTYDEYYIEDLPSKQEHEAMEQQKQNATQEQLDAQEAVRRAGTTVAAQQQAAQAQETNQTQETNQAKEGPAAE